MPVKSIEVANPFTSVEGVKPVMAVPAPNAALPSIKYSMLLMLVAAVAAG